MTPSTASHFDDSRGLLESLFHEAIAAANPMRFAAHLVPDAPGEAANLRLLKLVSGLTKDDYVIAAI